MPHHTKKRSIRHSKTKKRTLSSRPTLKEHGFRVLKHVAPSMSTRRSTSTIHRSIQNLIKNQNINRPVYNGFKKNASVKKVVHVENELMRARRMTEKQRNKNEREARRAEKARKVDAMENMNDLFSKMQL